MSWIIDGWYALCNFFGRIVCRWRGHKMLAGRLASSGEFWSYPICERCGCLL